MLTNSKGLKGRILVTGACGQIGSELVTALSVCYGPERVLASDVREAPQSEWPGVEYVPLNVMDARALEELVRIKQVTEIYHLAAVLSAAGEAKPLKGWDLNMQGLLNVLEVCRTLGVGKLFWPSSIAVFGPASGREAQQGSKIDPLTVYGISKQAGEQWCRYYWRNYGLDVRSLRYPGLISHTAKPGGGTTDYAVDIFYKALEDGAYRCFLEKDTLLPMMYMADAIRATLQLMEAPAKELSVRTSYNVAAMSFTPADLSAVIAGLVPGFYSEYVPDFRQQIADSWPGWIDDTVAKRDWGWQPEYGLESMTRSMLTELKQKLAIAT